MKELENIKKKNKGQQPKEKYDKLLVSNLKNPRKALENFKQIIGTMNNYKLLTIMYLPL